MFGRIICLTLFFLCVLAFSLLNTFPSYLFSFLDDEFYKWSSDVLPQTYLETEYEVPLDDFWLFWRCYTYLEDNVPFESDGFFFLKKEILVSVKKTNDNQNAWLFHRLIYQEPTCVRTHTFISFMCVLRRKRPLLRLSKLISSCNRNYILS